MNLKEFYGGEDPRYLLCYDATEAANYLRISKNIACGWADEQSRSRQRKEFLNGSQVPFRTEAHDSQSLSFADLIKLHVLRAVASSYSRSKASKDVILRVGIALEEEVAGQSNISHSLIHTEHWFEDVDRFIDLCENLMGTPKLERRTLREAISQHIERIELDEAGMAIRLYPFTRVREETSPRILAFDPRIAFGRLSIVGRGIPVEIIVSRYRAGDGIAAMAQDYDCPLESIEEALRSALPISA